MRSWETSSGNRALRCRHNTLALALAGCLGRCLIGLSALLVVLTVVQVMLPSLRFSLPFVAALHVVNALALLGVSAAMARQGRAEALARHKRLKHPVA